MENAPKKLTALLTKIEFATLPRWAIVAFIARCGRRVLHLYINDEAEPAEQRMAAAQAIRLAEERAALGGEFELNEALVISGQYYDNYDIDSLFLTLSGSVNAALNTYADLSSPDEANNLGRPILGVSSLAQIAFQVAFHPAYSQTVDLPEQAEDAMRWATLADDAVGPQLLTDFQEVRIRSLSEGWVDQTPVSRDIFRDLWRSSKQIY